MRIDSLRNRLVVAMLVVFSLGLGAAMAFYYFEVHASGPRLLGRTLEGQARELLAALHLDAAGNPTLALPPDWTAAYADKAGPFSFTLYDAGRRAVVSSLNLGTPLAIIAPPRSRAYGPLELVGVGADQRATLAARGPQGYVAVVSRGQLNHDVLGESLLEEDYENLSVLIPFSLAALVLIWLVSGWGLRPLKRASREAAMAGPRNPTARIGTDGLPSEIRPLVDAVNGALDRLADAYATERRFTADAAHELRTPLAVLGLRLQRARAEGVADWSVIDRELAQMNRLVAQLLDLARKEHAGHVGAASGLPGFNLARIVREAASTAVPLAEAAGRRIEVELPDSLAMFGRADDLRDAIRNLLDNALSHGQGTIRLTGRMERDADDARLVIEVADEGPGVPAGLQGPVFDRFRKGRQDTHGSGLGLSIVREVARGHGGTVRFLPGPGCRIQLALPAAVTDAPQAVSQKLRPDRPNGAVAWSAGRAQ